MGTDVRCPKTGRAIQTGKKVERTAFLATAVFFSRTYCPLCRATHEWFVKDAWVCDSTVPNANRGASDKLRSTQIW